MRTSNGQVGKQTESEDDRDASETNSGRRSSSGAVADGGGSQIDVAISRADRWATRALQVSTKRASRERSETTRVVRIANEASLA